jgi:hypothetical protein
MRRLRSFFSAVLLALWLPAMAHCEMEAAGLLGKTDACAGECAKDSCDLLENASFKSTTVAPHASAPVLVAELFQPAAITPPALIMPRLSPDRSESPPELARTWQFAVRAAPQPGAPSIAG